MVKKIIILALLLVIPFFVSSPIITYAANSDSTTQQTQKTTSWEQFWADLWATIGSFFSNFRMEIKSWFSKERPIPCVPKPNFTDYDDVSQDANTRAQAQSTQKYRKGTYLRSIIEGRYTDYVIAYFCGEICTNTKISDSCTDIKYSTLVYFFYKKGEKILYDKDDHKNPIAYDSEKMDSYNYTLPANSDTYFRNLYNNISQIPRGSFQEEKDAAGVASRELNNSLRTFIPASKQTATPSGSVFDPEGAKAMIVDNSTQQEAVFSSFIPNESLKSIVGRYGKKESVPYDATKAATLKEMYKDYLHPYSWQLDQEGLPEREDSGPCPAEKSHCHGMSQYGALGMAINGASYEGILKAYYGNIRLVNLKTIAGPNRLYIEVSNENGDACANKSRMYIEDYLRGLGELPSFWGDAKIGGMAALQAQAIAARTYAYVRTLGFSRPICTTAACQVFRCKIIGAKPNFDIAVKSTAYLVMVDAVSGRPFSSQYARSFCGPSISSTYRNSIGGISSTYTTPSFADSKAFEESAYKKLGKAPNSYCK